MQFKWYDKNDHSKGKIYTDWKDKDCYVDWCNEYMSHNLWLESCLGKKICRCFIYAQMRYCACWMC